MRAAVWLSSFGRQLYVSRTRPVPRRREPGQAAGPS
jgi:hypothetical protein